MAEEIRQTMYRARESFVMETVLLVAVFEKGLCAELHKPLPPWLRAAAKGLL